MFLKTDERKRKRNLWKSLNLNDSFSFNIKTIKIGDYFGSNKKVNFKA